MPPDSIPSHDGNLLRWLTRLRWVAVGGQAVALISAAKLLQLHLPWMPLVVGLALTSLSNHFLPGAREAGKGLRRSPLAIALVWDVLLLSYMLFWSGGADNPFVVFLLLFVALAAMMLGKRGLITVSVLCAASFTLLAFRHIPFEGPSDIVSEGQLICRIHRTGSTIAFVLLGVCLATFVHRMQRSVTAHQHDRDEALVRATDTDRFRSLATLAAGVAHELGTPLGTIAIASKELERALEKEDPDSGPLDDARLIRSEVDRCRAILRRLDQRTTRGTGSAPETVTTGSFEAALSARLSTDYAARLVVTDLAENARIDLSMEPVLQGLVVLIENGCEADPSGKPVEVEIRIAGGNVIFRVMDSGKGMTEAVRRRAGEPYFTTKAGDGTGLGLFLVRMLAMQLGGEVGLHIRADGGTSAVLKLPITQKADS